MTACCSLGGRGPAVTAMTAGIRIARAVTAVIIVPAVTAVTRRAFVTRPGGACCHANIHFFFRHPIYSFRHFFQVFATPHIFATPHYFFATPPYIFVGSLLRTDTSCSAQILTPLASTARPPPENIGGCGEYLKCGENCKSGGEKNQIHCHAPTPITACRRRGCCHAPLPITS
jgi:hypothetical protein